MSEAAQPVPRRVRWQQFAPYTGAKIVFWANEIADDFDAADRRHQEIKDELAKIKGLLFGLLVTTCGACIMLAATLLAGKR